MKPAFIFSPAIEPTITKPESSNVIEVGNTELLMGKEFVESNVPTELIFQIVKVLKSLIKRDLIIL